MKPLTSLIGLGFCAVPAFGEITEVVLTSVEVYNDQTNTGTTAVREYLVFDEADGVPDLDRMTLKINGASAIPIGYNAIYDQVKRRESFGSDPNAMLAARPLDGSYEFELFDAGNASLGTRTITGPVASSVSAFNERTPDAPVFTFLRGTTGDTALAGSWIEQNGSYIFRFDPTGLTSFRAVLSAATVGTIGEYFEHRFSVSNVTPGNFQKLEGGGGFEEITGGVPAYNGVTLSFSLNAAPDANDADVTTYGFTTGQTYSIEGEFFNHFNNDQTDGLFSSFVFGTTTAVLFQAIPEPAAFAQVAGVFALFGAGLRRRPRLG